MEPHRVLEVELTRPIGPIASVDPLTAMSYPRARILLRLGNDPVGLQDIDLDADGVDPERLCRAIWADHRDAINTRLAAHGCRSVAELTPSGLPFDLFRSAAAEEPISSDARVTVVVCTRDRADQLKVCLSRLLTLAYPDYDILVVDNAPSSPATSELVRELQVDHPRLRYVREERPGLPWARNRAIGEVDSAYMAFTDDDVCADTHWLSNLMRGFALAPQVAAVSGLTLPARLATPAELHFEALFSFTNGFEQVVHNLRSRPLTSPFYPYSAIRYATGNNIAYRVSALRALGGFDVTTRWGEDIELYFRATTRGHTLVYEPAALVYHAHRADIDGLRRQVFYYGAAFMAFLGKSVVIWPAAIPWLVCRAPAVLRALLEMRAAPYEKAAHDEIAHLRWRGMLNGPLWYLGERLSHIVTVLRFGPLPVHS